MYICVCVCVIFQLYNINVTYIITIKCLAVIKTHVSQINVLLSVNIYFISIIII